MADALVVNDFLHKLYLIWQMPKARCLLIALALTAITMLTGTFITPIIWNYFLIPKIERRVGEKYELSPLLNFFLFDTFICPQVELAKIIIKRYIALKRGKPFLNTKPAPGRIKIFWLAKVNYDIRQASRFEIFMAFFTLGIFILCPASLFLVFLITKFF